MRRALVVLAAMVVVVLVVIAVGPTLLQPVGHRLAMTEHPPAISKCTTCAVP